MVFFDEGDAVAPRRSPQGGSPYDKVTNKFLSIIDGESPLNRVFTVLTTNRLDILDPALIRSKRLKVLNVTGHMRDEDALRIVRKELNGIPLGEGLTFEEMVRTARPLCETPADFTAFAEKVRSLRATEVEVVNKLLEAVAGDPRRAGALRPLQLQDSDRTVGGSRRRNGIGAQGAARRGSADGKPGPGRGPLAPGPGRGCLPGNALASAQRPPAAGEQPDAQGETATRRIPRDRAVARAPGGLRHRRRRQRDERRAPADRLLPDLPCLSGEDPGAVSTAAPGRRRTRPGGADDEPERPRIADPCARITWTTSSGRSCRVSARRGALAGAIHDLSTCVRRP